MDLIVAIRLDSGGSYPCIAEQMVEYHPPDCCLKSGLSDSVRLDFMPLNIP